MTFGTQELRHGSSPTLPPGSLFLGGGGGSMFIKPGVGPPFAPGWVLGYPNPDTFTLGETGF